MTGEEREHLAEETAILNWLERHADRIPNCTWMTHSDGRVFNFLPNKTVGECAKTLRDAVREAMKAKIP